MPNTLYSRVTATEGCNGADVIESAARAVSN
jgi:hypothetical protein